MIYTYTNRPISKDGSIIENNRNGRSATRKRVEWKGVYSGGGRVVSDKLAKNAQNWQKLVKH